MPNLLQGAISGGGQGATAGAVAGPFGAIIGGAIGAGAGIGLSSLKKATPPPPPWYTQPKYWIAIGIGVLLVGFVLRKLKFGEL